MFNRLDKNYDLLLDQSELGNVNLDNVQCIKEFFNSCDTYKDSLISNNEWCYCFQRQQGKRLEYFANMSEWNVTLWPNPHQPIENWAIAQDPLWQLRALLLSQNGCQQSPAGWGSSAPGLLLKLPTPFGASTSVAGVGSGGGMMGQGNCGAGSGASEENWATGENSTKEGQCPSAPQEVLLKWGIMKLKTPPLPGEDLRQWKRKGGKPLRIFPPFGGSGVSPQNQGNFPSESGSR